MARTYYQGLFTPRHPEKYKGNVKNIRFMSSYEKSFFHFLDNNPHVIAWASEEISIPYIKPTTGRVHKYYPDIWMKYKNKNDEIVQEIVEIKPKKQTVPPTTKGKSKKTQLYEALTWAVNSAKWEAAKHFCDKYGMKFRIVAEGKIFK